MPQQPLQLTQDKPLVKKDADAMLETFEEDVTATTLSGAGESNVQ